MYKSVEVNFLLKDLDKAQQTTAQSFNLVSVVIICMHVIAKSAQEIKHKYKQILIVDI